MGKKYYYIISKNAVEAFDIECEDKLPNGDVCYLAKSCSTGEEVWLYKDCVKYMGCKKRHHESFPAYEVKQPAQGLAPYQYMWGQQILDKRTHSMCARPYFYR